MKTSGRARTLALPIPLVLSALLLSALGLVAVATPAQAATATGTISGTITNTIKVPLKGITVKLSSYDGDSPHTVASKTTGTAGTYAFTGVPVLPTGNPDVHYFVEVTDPAANHLGGYKDDIQVTANKTVTADFTLQKGASISGHLTRSDGKPAKGTSVWWWDDGNYPDQPVAGTVDAAGNYIIKRITAGTGYLAYIDNTGDYQFQCFDNVVGSTYPEIPCDAEQSPNAKTVTIAAGQDLTVKDQMLQFKAGHIAGIVTDTKKHPLKDEVFNLIDAKTGEEMPNIDATTNAKGAFDIGNIPPGTWKLNIPPTEKWANYWFNGKSTKATANVITVVGGKTVTIAPKLKSLSILTVKATPGVGKATFAITVTKNSTGNPGGGNTSVTGGGTSTWGPLKDGKRTLTLKGLKKGKTTFTIVYGGSIHTAGSTKTVTITIK